MAIADQPRVIGLAVAESLRRLRRRVLAGQSGGFGLMSQVPDRLVLAPRDLHTADPTIAQDIYAGLFHFCGRSASCAGTSPFQISPPSDAWRRELHSFGWLRHLHAAGDAVSANNAQVLVKDWVDLFRHPSRHPAWDVETTGLRLVAWLCHSVPIVQNADLSDYRRFLRSVGQHIRFLRRTAGQAPDGMPRLTARIALAYAAACVSGRSVPGPAIWKHLDEELAHQISSDGVHISRNPAVLPELLALLLPLRESVVRLGQAPSPEFVSSIDRIALAIRYFRLGDGSVARFNGASATPHDLIATVLRYDDSLDNAPGTGSFSGYQRLSRNGTVLIMDAAEPPRGELSTQAHAGVLSFEMSSGEAPIVINCGIPPLRAREAVLAARSTAAHSTMSVNDQSSCRFNGESLFGRYLENRIISGPARVTCTSGQDKDTITTRAGHDGYVRRFGLVHERQIALSADGGSVMGNDRVFRPNGRPIRGRFNAELTVRFHLHPSVSASKAGDGRNIHLSCGGRVHWIFTCVDVEPQLEESIFFAVANGSRRTVQIVLRAEAAERDDIRWMFWRGEAGPTEKDK